MNYYHVTEKGNLDSILLRLGLLVSPPHGKETIVMSLYRLDHPEDSAYICMSDATDETHDMKLLDDLMRRTAREFFANRKGE
jgi:hypothetical protein